MTGELHDVDLLLGTAARMNVILLEPSAWRGTRFGFHRTRLGS